MFRQLGPAHFQGHGERIEQDDITAKFPAEILPGIPGREKIQCRRQQQHDDGEVGDINPHQYTNKQAHGKSLWFHILL
jgi:hypothetical protein